MTGAACFETEVSPASVLMIERRSMFATWPPAPDQARPFQATNNEISASKGRSSDIFCTYVQPIQQNSTGGGYRCWRKRSWTKDPRQGFDQDEERAKRVS